MSRAWKYLKYFLPRVQQTTYNIFSMKEGFDFSETRCCEAYKTHLRRSSFFQVSLRQRSRRHCLHCWRIVINIFTIWRYCGQYERGAQAPRSFYSSPSYHRSLFNKYAKVKRKIKYYLRNEAFVLFLFSFHFFFIFFSFLFLHLYQLNQRNISQRRKETPEKSKLDFTAKKYSLQGSP